MTTRRNPPPPPPTMNQGGGPYHADIPLRDFLASNASDEDVRMTIDTMSCDDRLKAQSFSPQQVRYYFADLMLEARRPENSLYHADQIARARQKIIEGTGGQESSVVIIDPKEPRQ